MRIVDKLTDKINDLANKEVRLVEFLLPGEAVNAGPINPSNKDH